MNIICLAFDGIASFTKEIYPNNNDMTGIKKLLVGRELPHRKIDVCLRVGCYFKKRPMTWIDA